MDVTPLVWWLSAGIAGSVLVLDVFVIGRNPSEPSRRQVGVALAVFVGLAVAFGVGVWLSEGARYGTEFFAAWLTEYSLSVDNLFVFMVLMAAFAVPRAYQQVALLVGIVLALILRGVFIALGAAAIEHVSWVFYVFGAFLVYTGIKLATGGMESEAQEPAVVRWLERHVPLTSSWEYGAGLLARVGGRRLATPMLLVVVALGTADLLFAVDSIPASYGLTDEPYLVLTANLFALMGLRQLYFLLGGLLERLTYLSYGLAFLLGFIGVKLLLHALHTNELGFLNGGRPVTWAPDVPVWLSLVVIVATFAVTTAASLARPARDRAEVG